MPFYKSKKFIIFAVIVGLIIVSIIYGRIKKANTPVEYETAEVQRGTITQTVEATGKIKSADDLELRFELSGVVGEVLVKEGNAVKADDLLMKLRTAELDAAVAQASANLNQKLAGATKEDIAYYQAAVDLAYATLNQTKADSAHSIATAELAVQTAYNNLKLAEGGENSQIVSDTYEDAVAALQKSASVMDSSLTQADNILGIDNTLANEDFEDYLSVLDSSKLTYANQLYYTAKTQIDSAKSVISMINLQSAHAEVDQALITSETGLDASIKLLAAVKDVLNATIPAGSLTQTSLDTKKTTIETAQTSATTQYNTVITTKQAIATAKNSYTTYSIAYQSALSDFENTKLSATSAAAIKQAAYEQALANLDSKKNPPREVDVAALRAALAQAIANRNKAILKAPIDGIVTKINKKRGEFVSMSEVALKLLSPHYEVDVDIPETDVVKLQVQDSVAITLDAYGEDIKFSGKVMAIDPASTEVQDVVYYKVKVAIDDTEQEIKSGMTANVTVSTAEKENVLNIPSRAVRTADDGSKYVKVLKDGRVVDNSVQAGLRADNGRLEIVSGLNEGDEVIISVKES